MLEELKSRNLQPKMLPGYVRAERVRCGKSGCKCARGKLHGPYFYHFTWSDGRRRKRYVKSSDVAAVRAACGEFRDFQRELRRGREQWRTQINVLRGLKDERN